MQAILLISLLFISGILSAQNFSVSLSDKHLKKLQSYQSGHKRLKQYYKFYHKDSLGLSRKQNKKFRKELDSAYRANLKREKLRRRLARQGINLPDERTMYVDSLNKQIARCWQTLNDTSLSDSLKTLVKMNARKLAIEKVKLDPGYQNVINSGAGGDSLRWQRLVTDVPGLDTLSALFDFSPDQFFATVERVAEDELMKGSSAGMLGEQFAKAQGLMTLPDQYKQQYESFTNKDSLESTAKQLAAAEVIKRFEENAPVKEAQQYLGKLLSKYRKFSSGDLSHAVKHTSLKGKTFRERLVMGGNFNIVSTSPASIDISPQVGYKFNTRFFIGLGMNYRCTFGDSIKSSYYVSPNSTSFNAFLTHDVFKSFYATAQWEKSGIVVGSNDKSSKQWKDNYFMGVGKRMLIHSTFYFTVTALYNLNNEHENPVHPNRFQLRMGFQLSELATRRPEVNYNPNR